MHTYILVDLWLKHAFYALPWVSREYRSQILFKLDE